MGDTMPWHTVRVLGCMKRAAELAADQRTLNQETEALTARKLDVDRVALRTELAGPARSKWDTLYQSKLITTF